MTLFQTIALLISLTAVFSYVNYRFIKLPTTVGVMLVALLVSAGLIVSGYFDPEIRQKAAGWLQLVEFEQALMQGMLSFLLFAGALHIDLDELAEERTVVSVLALGGVVISMFIFGTIMHVILGALGLPMSYAWCLLFGALISPTDPIAVIGTLKSANVPRKLELQIAGESLFNDGVGVVAFLVCSELVMGDRDVSIGHMGVLFLKEAVGGALFGLGIGYITYRLLRSVDRYQVEVLLTLALVTGGYALANALHLSGPIAVVVAGLLIGNHGRRFAMSNTTREHIDTFWELIDEVLNAILFVLIGLEVLVLTFTRELFFSGLLAIPVILLARWISVSVPIALMKKHVSLSRGAITVMTWGGLRGGISVALALSLPAGSEREVIVSATYIVVVFSILVQGLTVGGIARRAIGSHLP